MDMSDIDLLTLLFSAKVQPFQISQIMGQVKGPQAGTFSPKRLHNIKPPNVLLVSVVLGNVVAMASENVAATAFNDDLVRHVDDENATFVHGDATGNAAGLAC